MVVKKDIDDGLAETCLMPSYVLENGNFHSAILEIFFSYLPVRRCSNSTFRHFGLGNKDNSRFIVDSLNVPSKMVKSSPKH